MASSSGTRLLTDVDLRSAAALARKTGKDVWRPDPAPRGAGRLTFKFGPTGNGSVIYRYTPPGEDRTTMTLGPYDSAGVRGLTLKQAREEAGKLSRRYTAGAKDLKATLNAERAAVVAQENEQRRAAEAAAEHAARGSLRDLLDAYVDTLAGRPSQREVRNALKLHVSEAHSTVVALPASDVGVAHFTTMLFALIEAGKGRTAGKIRSYLHAAYQVALLAEGNPKHAGRFKSFAVTSNPIDRVASLSEYTRARDRALSRAEVRAFWQRLQASPPSLKKDAVVAAMLLGGQRPHQMLRLTIADVDLAGKTLTLYDTKGRNRHARPRKHVLPILEELMPTMRRLTEAARSAEKTRRSSAELADHPAFVGTTLVFSKDGQTPLREETAAKLVAKIRDEMDTAGELEGGHFTFADLRRTVETRLAELKVHSDIRAQLQSHGISGVQAKHYDRYDYMDDKAAALRLWLGLLTFDMAT
jgi:integrase